MLRYHTPKFLFRRHEVIKKINAGHSFLEIGPGSLNLTEDLVNYFSVGTLIECNPKTKEIFKTTPAAWKQRLHLIIGDFMVLDLPSTYDCIIACEVMEHIENDGEFMDKVSNLLNEGGLLILSVPAHKKMWGKDDESVGHLRRYEKKELHDLLSGRGLKNINIISYGYPFSNVLRLLRILFTDKLYKRKNELSTEARSAQSGISPLSGLFWCMKFLLNKYTISPFCVLSSLFNYGDLSDSYLITAQK